MNCNVIGFPFSNGQELARYMNVEQITKADRLRVSRHLRKGKSRATLRRLSSTVPPHQK
jgi:hypothetical protein